MAQVRVDAERLRAKHLPVLSAMTQNDRIIEWELPVELARHYGATYKQITYFDENEQVVYGPETGQCMSHTITV